MAAESAKDFERALLKKGFQLERRTGDKIFYLYHDGRRTQIHTKISEGRSEELRDKLLGLIKRQMFFDTTAQLSEFIECSIDGPAYVDHLRRKQVLT